MIFWFSGTGGSEHVARRLAELLDDRLISVAECMCDGKFTFTLAQGEKIGFVFPVYSWGPAPVVAEFAKRLKLNEYLPERYCYAVPVCGDEVGMTVQMFRSALKNVRLSAAFSVQMPNNYILLPGFDVDVPAVERAKIEECEDRISHIALRVASSREDMDIVVGQMAWLKSRVVYPLFKCFYTSDRGFKVDDKKCNGCGMCVKSCSICNISLEEKNGVKRPEWHHNCAMCLSCIHRCPCRAIEYGKATQKKGRYYYKPIKK